MTRKAEDTTSYKDKKFRDHFLKSITEARKENKINHGEFAVLWFASLFPKQLAKIEELVEHEATHDETFASGSKSAIDWVSLIKTLLPLILQIIALFQQPHATGIE